MKKVIVVAIAAGLSACMGSGSGGSGGGAAAGAGGASGADASRLAGAVPTGTQRYNLERKDEKVDELESVTYDRASNTLTVGGDPFDMAGVFRREAGGDVAGYAAFVNDAGARRYLALATVDSTHQLAAAVVATPFRFDQEYGGTMVARGATPTLPTNREVTHTGRYGGLRQVGVNTGADGSTAQLYRVEGDVVLNFDFFADNRRVVEGAIFNRRSLDGRFRDENGRRQSIRYDDVVLSSEREDGPRKGALINNIDDTGRFEGYALINGEELGRYEGLIAGPNAAASAGMVSFEDGTDFERGIFMGRSR